MRKALLLAVLGFFAGTGVVATGAACVVAAHMLHFSWRVRCSQRQEARAAVRAVETMLFRR